MGGLTSGLAYKAAPEGLSSQSEQGLSSGAWLCLRAGRLARSAEPVTLILGL